MPSDLYQFADSLCRDAKSCAQGQRQGRADRSRERLRPDRAHSGRRATRSSWTCPMPVRRIVSHPQIKTNAGKVAFQRGPIVFCLEGPDNEGEVLSLVIPDDAKLKAEYRPDLLNGVVAITGKAKTAKRTLDGKSVTTGSRSFTAIPYYAWAHRGGAQMTVWPAREPQAARPQPADTPGLHEQDHRVLCPQVARCDQGPELAPELGGQLAATGFLVAQGHDRVAPVRVGEASAGLERQGLLVRRHRPGRVPRAQELAGAVSHGRRRVQAGEEQSPLLRQKDAFNKVAFEPVKTAALKIEIVLQEKWSAGVQEVVIE